MPRNSDRCRFRWVRDLLGVLGSYGLGCLGLLGVLGQLGLGFLGFRALGSPALGCRTCASHTWKCADTVDVLQAFYSGYTWCTQRSRGQSFSESWVASNIGSNQVECRLLLITVGVPNMSLLQAAHEAPSKPFNPRISNTKCHSQTTGLPLLCLP